MRLVILVLVGLALGLPAAAAEGESGPYPIWWSPSLELDSLDRIDARLQRPLWPDDPDSGLDVIVHDESFTPQREEFAQSCADMLRMERLVEEFADPRDLYTWIHHSARCRALEHLREAVPARRSFVRDFVLNEAAIDVLPVMLQPGFACSWLCEALELNKTGMTWREYWIGQHEEILRDGVQSWPEDEELEENIFRIETISDHQLDVETIGGWMTIHILARADFTGDGLEDLLILVDYKVKGGRLYVSNLHFFTRETAGEVFRVIDPEGYLCPDYQCD